MSQNNDDSATVCANCGEPLVPPVSPAQPASGSVPGSATPSVPPVPPPPPAAGVYGQQAAPSAAPVPPFSTGGVPPMPPTYLWQSIVVLLLCCWPLGIPAVVFAAQVSSKYSKGDYQGAIDASNKAKGWTIAAFVCGLIAIIIYVILMIAGVMSYNSSY